MPQSSTENPADSSVRLVAIVYAQGRIAHWRDGQLEPRLLVDTEIPATRSLAPGELQNDYVPTSVKPSDVPKALSAHASDSNLQTWYQSQTDIGRMIQYVFSDGLILTAPEILRHPYSTRIPRHLWPIMMNVSDEFRGEHPFRIDSARAPGFRSSWVVDTEKVLLSILVHASRLKNREGFELLFTQNESVHESRKAMRLDSLGLLASAANRGRWRLRPHTDVARTGEGGRALLRFEFFDSGEATLRTRHFQLSVEKRRLEFHAYWAQVNQVLQNVASQAPISESPIQHEAAEAARENAAIDLSGHSQIQASILEINDILQRQNSPPVEILPASIDVQRADVTPRLLLSSGGGLRVNTFVRLASGNLEVGGLPPAMMYIAVALQQGIGATTGLTNSQIAYKRRGIKRDRDMKLLKHLGFSTLIFYEAANFALGLPLSDGSRHESPESLLNHLYTRLGSLILKAEGWPIQSGSLETLCSKNITALIEGFVRQVIRDCNETVISVFMPEGEIRLQGFAEKIVAFYRALVNDLAVATQGSVFERARTKYFENFVLSSRKEKNSEDADLPRIEAPELVSFRAPADNPQAQVFAAIERMPVYHLPESSQAPRGMSLFMLSEIGFMVFFEGQAIETFDLEDFRPEFTLEESPLVVNDTRKIDWFELHPKFFFKGVEIPIEQAARISREGVIEFQGKLFRLKPEDMPHLDRLKTFWDRIQGHTIATNVKIERRKTFETFYQLPKSQTLELLALRASGVKVKGGERWQKICNFYDRLDEKREPPQLPDSFRAELKAYQCAGVRWLSDLFELGLGGILADDMGLGKTVTTLALLERLRSEGRMGPSLIVVPTSLTFNWTAEIEKFTPELPVRLYQSRQGDELLDFLKENSQAVVIATYGLLQENAGWFGQTEWNIVVFDEAQNLKNISAKRTTAARQIKSGFKICLTGTPLENHYGEFFSLFDLILPGGLGDLAQFREKYVNPAVLLREDLDFLRMKTRPLVLRRTKSQVMQELPPKIETTMKLPFENEQKRIYRDIAASYNEQIMNVIREQGEARSQLQMLTALLRLRQACSDPASIPNVRYAGEPPKLSVLLEALEGITESGESALIFTQFLATFNRIKDALAAKGITCFEISGSDSRAVREKRLKAFSDAPGGAVMLMTLKTGGVGLNLTKASYVFHIEPWWNPAVENQATDRAHRIGQSKTVQVYRYIIKESVEEKIEVLKEIKGQRFNSLFTEVERDSEVTRGSGHLSQADFEFLLS